ncbi:LPS:glycosyltransferase (RfaJ) (PDB:1G9R) [Commensalibacter communis]|uniref:DUF4422 domain-containing protein n=1 Tax=Commensalibacter communis TaxID=2972786 RepID=UPI0022FF7396|nr:DUF4422 domain-containing protein [Commensalibacter communis]CAI3957975.1 LPS:glycosyltransferase (RfaJ) (PDB:1G9R) [Commensalibacter communis]CAI3958288.1 LPS:glycosyltransferase (RfaJ) (PDB:1G9R) [Commensalibacter communis]
MKKISLYVSYHNQCDLIKTNYFKPIQVGTAYSKPLHPSELNDAIGDNISLKNKSFCELTAQYWAWKNDLTSEYIGFCHYRRHFIFNPDNTTENNIYGVTPYDQMDQNYLKDVGYSDKDLEKFLVNVDVVAPEKWDVRNHYAKNNLDQYKNGPNLYIEDYYTCLDILRAKYPEYEESITSYNVSTDGYYTNMFIMKRDIFEHYSAWLFEILFELEKKLNLDNRDIQEYRVFGYISEWLLGIYLTQLRRDKKLNIVECRRTFVNNANTGNYQLTSQQPLAITNTISTSQLDEIKKNYKKIVPIVTAFNENYAITGAALIQSIIENGDPTCFYDIYIIEGALSDTTKFNFHFMFRRLENFSLNIINVDHFFANKDLNLHAHFSKETYYRILIPTILPQYDKVIYLDADMVVNKDIQHLFDTDIGNNSIAAVKDYVMAGFIKFKIMCRDVCGGLTTEEYLKQYLGMKNPHNYAQAGVLIFNTKKFRKTGVDQDILQDMCKASYWFLDQDLLNKHLEGDIYYLDTQWNVLHGNGNVDSFYKKLPLPIMEDYFKARKDPWIIHFAGEQKPWFNPTADFASIFFYYLRNTPWKNNRTPTPYMPSNTEHRVEHKVEQIYINPNFTVREILKPFVNRFLPLGTKRRQLMYKLYIMARKKL